MFKYLKCALLCFMLLTCSSVMAQNGRITGTVRTSDGEPTPQATVSLNGLRQTASAENGRYTFKNIPAGTYTLTVTYTGLESQSKGVTLQAGEEVTVDFELSGNSSVLKEVAVETARRKRIVQRETQSPSRLPLRNLENPQTYNVVNSALFNQQIAVERTDIYYNIPGALPNFSAGGSQGLSLRGFSNTNGFRNGLGTSAIYPMNPAIIEQIEVMKGPSGTLFGTGRSTTFGGAYNYVTKRPFGYNAVELGLTAGSFNLTRASADINQVLDAEGKQQLRVNAAWQNQGSFQDQGYAKNFVFAPSFSYQATEKLKFLVEMSAARNRYTTTSFALGSLTNISFRNFRDWKLPYDRSLSNNSVDADVSLYDVGAEAEYTISESWKSHTKFLYSEGRYDHLLWGTFTIATDSTVSRSVRNQTPETFGNVELQQNFIGDFKLAGLRDRIVIGLDYNTNYNMLNRYTVPFDVVNINKPGITDFSKQQIDNASAGKFAGSTFRGTAYAAYVSNVLNITPELTAMTSLRVERYTTKGVLTLTTGKRSGDYEQTSLSPKFGLVYQVLPEKLSVFANYMNGYANLAPAQQRVDGGIEGLKPQYANQLEGGIKYSFLQDRISGSVSYYDIKVTNSTRSETVSGQALTIQDGTQRSKGFEFDLTANPINGLNIVAGYAYNENKYEKASPALEGKTLMASPKNIANFWASYVFTTGTIQGIGLGAGANYVSDSWFDSANLFTLPSYTLINATVFYDRPKYRIGVKANNLRDEHYWNQTGMPQNPRNFLIDLRLRF